MKTAIYPGSFNPYHEGHRQIVGYALRVFDKVIIAVGQNADKPTNQTSDVVDQISKTELYGIKNGCIEVVTFSGLFADYVNEQNKSEYKINAVIRGLRNSADFEQEKTLLYWNQDLNIGIPTMFFMAGRNLAHVSSSAIRAIDKARSK